MIAAEVQKLIREQIAGEVAFRPFGEDRLGVSLPFTFGDGDACEVVVSNGNGDAWTISDEGYVVALAKMQGINLLSTGYANKFRELASFYGAEEHNGEVQMRTTKQRLGDSLFLFIQACLELARLMDREPDRKKRKKEFARRFSRAVEKSLPADKLSRRWFDESRDPKGIYRADYRVLSDGVNWLIYGAGSAGKVWKAASAVQHYRLTKLPLETIFAYGKSAMGDDAAFEVMADNANHRFSIETDRLAFQRFLKSHVR